MSKFEDFVLDEQFPVANLQLGSFGALVRRTVQQVGEYSLCIDDRHCSCNANKAREHAAWATQRDPLYAYELLSTADISPLLFSDTPEGFYRCDGFLMAVDKGEFRLYPDPKGDRCGTMIFKRVPKNERKETI